MASCLAAAQVEPLSVCKNRGLHQPPFSASDQRYRLNGGKVWDSLVGWPARLGMGIKL